LLLRALSDASATVFSIALSIDTVKNIHDEEVRLWGRSGGKGLYKHTSSSIIIVVGLIPNKDVDARFLELMMRKQKKHLKEQQISAAQASSMLPPPRILPQLDEAGAYRQRGVGFEHQAAYYQALQESTRRTDSAPFIEFTLTMIRNAIAATPQAAPQVTPQVRLLLRAIQQGEMSRENPTKRP
jgi:hypothetical protein